MARIDPTQNQNVNPTSSSSAQGQNTPPGAEQVNAPPPEDQTSSTQAQRGGGTPWFGSDVTPDWAKPMTQEQFKETPLGEIMSRSRYALNPLFGGAHMLWDLMGLHEKWANGEVNPTQSRSAEATPEGPERQQGASQPAPTNDAPPPNTAAAADAASPAFDLEGEIEKILGNPAYSVSITQQSPRVMARFLDLHQGLRSGEETSSSTDPSSPPSLQSRVETILSDSTVFQSLAQDSRDQLVNDITAALKSARETTAESAPKAKPVDEEGEAT